MEKDYPELFGLNVTTVEAETMLENAKKKTEKTRKNLEATWFTNRNKSIRKKAVENAIREVDLAEARLEITKAAAQMKMNLNIKKRNQGSKVAARASIENNIRKMNQEQTKKGLLKRKKVEFPGPAPPALKPGAPAVAVSGAPAVAVSGAPAVAVSGAPAVVFPPRPKGPRPPPVTASTPGLPGGPVAPPRVPKPNNLIKAAAADIRRALIERNYSNINKNQNTRKGLLRRKRLNFPDPDLRVRPPGHKPKNLINAAEVRARAAAGILPLGLPPKPNHLKRAAEARARAAAGLLSPGRLAAPELPGGPEVLPGFEGIDPIARAANINARARSALGLDQGDQLVEGLPRVNKLYIQPPINPLSSLTLPFNLSKLPGLTASPELPGGHPGGPAAGVPVAPSPRQPTAASTNNSPKNIKTRIGTIRQKFAEAKAKINAFKARPKTKAKGGSRTRKLKSRR